MRYYVWPFKIIVNNIPDVIEILKNKTYFVQCDYWTSIIYHVFKNFATNVTCKFENRHYFFCSKNCAIVNFARFSVKYDKFFAQNVTSEITGTCDFRPTSIVVIKQWYEILFYVNLFFVWFYFDDFLSNFEFLLSKCMQKYEKLLFLVIFYHFRRGKGLFNHTRTKHISTFHMWTNNSRGEGEVMTPEFKFYKITTTLWYIRIKRTVYRSRFRYAHARSRPSKYCSRKHKFTRPSVRVLLVCRYKCAYPSQIVSR